MNNHVNDSTGVSPFFANTGRHPKMTLDLPALKMATSGPAKLEQEVARDFAKTLTNLHTQLRLQLQQLQLQQTDLANKKRQPHPHYKVGDLVYVSTKNFKTARPSQKLDLKFAGPYKITEALSDEPLTYRLDLLEQVNVHNAFHASLLQPASDPLPGQHQPPPPPIEVTREGEDTAEEWEVAEVLDSKVMKQKGRVAKGKERQTWVEYRVRWKGYDELTWETEDAMEGALDLVYDFHRRHPAKSIPQSLSLPTKSRSTEA